MKCFLGLILITVISIQLISQVACDPTSKSVFFLTDKMPVPSIDFLELTSQINSNFNMGKCRLKEGDKLVLTFNVNCKGEDLNYTFKKITGEDVACGIAAFSESLLSFSAAVQNKENVNFKGTIIYEIRNSSFKLISETLGNLTARQIKKHHKE